MAAEIIFVAMRLKPSDCSQSGLFIGRTCFPLTILSVCDLEEEQFGFPISSVLGLSSGATYKLVELIN